MWWRGPFPGMRHPIEYLAKPLVAQTFIAVSVLGHGPIATEESRSRAGFEVVGLDGFTSQRLGQILETVEIVDGPEFVDVGHDRLDARGARLEPVPAQ